jgi:lipopolysaccharide transport system permease protein
VIDSKRPSHSPLSEDQDAASAQLRVISARSGWRPIDLTELWRYRDLFYYLVWRDIKSRYAQSVFGIGWAVIQPLFFMIVFTLVFDKLTKVGSDGVPYPVFSYAALVVWTYFANSFNEATGSLVNNAGMIGKVYFPRLVLPISAVLAKLVDLVIAFTLLIALMAWYGLTPQVETFALPVLVLIAMTAAAGLGMALSALAIQYRDIKYALQFGVQLLMYASPVVYPTSLVPDKYLYYYALNPMVGVIEGSRSALLGTNPMPWDLIGIGAVSSIVLFIVGVFYFRRTERIFADVV